MTSDTSDPATPRAGAQQAPWPAQLVLHLVHSAPEAAWRAELLSAEGPVRAFDSLAELIDYLARLERSSGRHGIR